MPARGARPGDRRPTGRAPSTAGYQKENLAITPVSFRQARFSERRTDAVNRADALISRFGNQSDLARALGIRPSTVQYWSSKGTIPRKRHSKIIEVGRALGLHIDPLELSAGYVPPHTSGEPAGSYPESPFAKWRGRIELGEDELDVYVLDTGERVIDERSAAKAITGGDRSELRRSLADSALRPYVNGGLVLDGLRDFAVPARGDRTTGLTTEQFELICRVFVQALYDGAPLREGQRRIAVKCAVLAAGLARTGLDALIDDSTGWRSESSEDTMQVKLRAFVTDRLRAWEKTFPDELWEELARLTGWNGPPESRPRYWAGLVIELIYDTLDPEAAGYLREHRPRDVHPHRNAAGDHGPEQLLSRCYEIVGLSRSCDSIGELRRKVAQHYARQPMLFSIFEIPASPDD